MIGAHSAARRALLAFLLAATSAQAQQPPKRLSNWLLEQPATPNAYPLGLSWRVPSEEASQLLVQKALEAGIGRFADRDAVEQVRSRAAFGGITIDIDAALAALCEGRISFAELEGADLLGTIRPSRINQAAPERMKLPGGREVKVHYEPGKPPWIGSSPAKRRAAAKSLSFRTCCGSDCIKSSG